MEKEKGKKEITDDTQEAFPNLESTDLFLQPQEAVLLSLHCCFSWPGQDCDMFTPYPLYRSLSSLYHQKLKQEETMNDYFIVFRIRPNSYLCKSKIKFCLDLLMYVWIFLYLLFCCSVVQSCPTLCDPMDCSASGFPILHHLPEFAQT